MYSGLHRVVLVAALRGERLAPALAEAIHDLIEAGLLRGCVEVHGTALGVLLTETGARVAARERDAALWLLWRRLYRARRDRAVTLGTAGRVEDARRMNARAARALKLARRRFEQAYGVEGGECRA